jgi:Cu+-exporting ATPase
MGEHHHGHHAGAAAAGGVRDPVCGMTVVPERARTTAEHAGQTYYFCCPGCAAKFQTEPARYLGPLPAPATPPRAAGVEYTCPMHPEVVQVGPGACPLCGMALEPRVVVAEEAPSPELVDMTRRFRLCLVLTLPLFATTMADMLPGEPLRHRLPRPPGLGQLALATPVVLWAARRSSAAPGSRCGARAPTCSP